MGKKSIFWSLLVFLLLVSSPIFATHIVGGEFELLHEQGNRYRLRLILYNDDVNGNPGAIDPNAQVFIWSKRNDRLIMSVNLPYFSRVAVPYTNPACAIAQLVTSKVVYETSVILNSYDFSDAEGYYVSYERCCRNNIISNIESPDAAGQTFYLEFPPVVRNGEEFINSSPRLFPPLSDFARLGYPFYFDFRGSDPDGDSLVYSLAAPLAGYSTPDMPIPSTPYPAPYPQVIWRPGYSVTNMVPGDPALNINSDGFLRVKPSQTGLFVFSVKAEEYRDGIKIGEVRRDFQMLVYDVPGEDFPPLLIAEKQNGQIFQDSIKVTEADFDPAAAERCLSLKVTDADIQQEDGFTERLRFRVIPRNFADASAIQLSIQQGVVTSQQPELFLQMCLPQCPPIFGQPYLFDVVAYDDVCSMPLTDTLRVRVDFDVPDNEPAYLLNIPDREPIRSASYSIPVVQEGRAYDFVIEGFDIDGDALDFAWVAQGFNAEEWGFSFNLLEDRLEADGGRRIRYGVHWDATCSSGRDFGQRDKFSFLFTLDDAPECDQHEEATYLVDFSVVMPGNIPPDVRTSLNNYQAIPAQNMLAEEVMYGDPVAFAVRATDQEQDQLYLRAMGKDFNLQDWGMTFEDASGAGVVTGNFAWDPACAQLVAADKDEFILHFITVDAAECKTSLSDTITVQLVVRFPENAPPSISAHPTGEINQTSPYEVAVGDELSILLRGIDANRSDNLLLRLESVQTALGDVPYDWQDVSGTGGEVSSLLNFAAACELLMGAPEALITFNFSVNDNSCFDQKADTVSVQVLLKDRPQDWDRVQYVNFFSPNGDQCNQYFEITNLPEDACNNQFEYVRIYNRWGRLLYESNERNFKWDGDGQGAGTYYYLLKYTSMEYRSPLTLSLGDQAGGMVCP